MTPHARNRHRGRRVLEALAWTAVALALLTASALVHLASRVGRAACADALAVLLTSRVLGASHIGAVTRLDFDGIEMRDVLVTAPDGEPVASMDRVSGDFAFGESLSRRAFVLTGCEMDGGEVRITRGPTDQINLIRALEVPDDRWTLPVEMRDIRLLDLTTLMSLPGLPGEMDVADVYGLADLTIGHVFSLRLDRVHGYASFPIADVGFDSLNGRLRGHDLQPLVLRMILDLEVADPAMEVRYLAPRAIGRDGEGHARIEIGADVPDASGVATRRGSESASVR